MIENMTLPRRRSALICAGLAVCLLLSHAAAVEARPRWSCKPRSANHASCCGDKIKLSQVLGQCDVAAYPGKRRSLKKSVSFTLTATPNPARSGQKVTVKATFKNLTRKPVDLYFVGHAGPMLRLSVKAKDGASVYPPPGKAPRGALLPRPGPPYPVRIRLSAGGEAVHQAKWKVQRWAWGDGAGPGPGRPAMAGAGPLKPGKYKISMSTMFAHEGFGLPRPEVTLTVEK